MIFVIEPETIQTLGDEGSAARFLLHGEGQRVGSGRYPAPYGQTRFVHAVARQIDYAAKRNRVRHVRRDRHDWSSRDALGIESVLIEREVEYVEDIERRMKLVFEKTAVEAREEFDGMGLLFFERS